MKTEKNIQLGILIVDICVLTLHTIGFYFLMRHLLPGSVNGIASLPWLVVTYVFSFFISFSFYPSILQYRDIKWEEVVKRALTTCFVMLLFISLITLFTRPYSHFPRGFFCYSMLSFATVLILERLGMRYALTHLRANKHNIKNVVLVGNEPAIGFLQEHMSNPAYGYNILGTFYNGNMNNEAMQKLRIGRVEELYPWLVEHPEVNEIYAYFPKEQQERINIISKYCDNHLVRFYYIPAIDVFKGRMAITFMNDIPIIARREEPLRTPVNKCIKRIFDICFSTVVLLTVFPIVWLIVSIVIKIQSPGPVFFLQERTGLDGKVFKCIKFRSMKVNNEADTLQATENDPRKFPFGNLMRKLNIDELPQFVNVFIGDMSVVGPRPHMLKHTEEYSTLINRFMLRHFVKPGITGLAQVSGFRGETRYIDQMEGRVKKDIEYIENWSFWLDIKIIIKTVTNMLGREKGNAY